MPARQIPIVSVRGLTPLIDPKRLQDPVVVEGKNFYVTPDGPTSGFARTEILHRAIVSPKGVQSFQIKDQGASYIFTESAVLEYDPVTRQLFPRVTYPTVQGLAPWSHAVVGGNLYFTRRDAGLIQYHTPSGEWSILSGPAIPVNIVALTASGGRLCLLARGIFAWSAIDDGTNFVASTVTGAGAQSLSIVNATGAGQALMCLPYEFGVLSYTTEGILRSELIEGSINPFRHRAISNEHVPINPYCVSLVNQNEQVILTKSGFYITTGQRPEPWQALMSEHLHLNVLPRLDLAVEGKVRLSRDFDRGWFMVSINEKLDFGVYDFAFVLYLQSDQWGSFNRTHTGFLDINTRIGANAQYRFGYVNQNGSIFQFSDDVVDRLYPDDNLYAYDYRVPREWPARIEGPIFGCPCRYHMPSALSMPPISEHLFDGVANVYDLNPEVGGTEDFLTPVVDSLQPGSQWDNGLSVWDNGLSSWDVMLSGMKMRGGLRHFLAPVTVAAPKFNALDSFISIGVFRLGEGIDIDELMEILTVSISAIEPPLPVVFEDYIADYADIDVFQDWNTDDFLDEDYGESRVLFSNYDLKLRGTIDGFTTWENQEKVPCLIQEEGRTRFYDAKVTGLYHRIELSAFDVDQAYHLKTLELEALPVGRLK